MTMMQKRLRYVVFLALGAAAYFFLKALPLGGFILYPFQLLATILHEFGHGIFAILTGGEISKMQINTDGSGWTQTMGGSRLLILIGGYVGSAIFGNLLLRAGLVHARWSTVVLNILLVIMIAICTIWSASIANTIFVAMFALAIYFIGRLHEEVASWFLIAMGSLSILHIIEDFNVGPMSDLANFAQVLPILPQRGWMYAWLAIVVLITWMNLKSILLRAEVE
jgi:hypothetical protein